MIDAMDVTTLVQCDDCDAVIPVIVRATGELQPLGTGGDCLIGHHSFTLRGRRIVPRGKGTETETPVRKWLARFVQ